jgi:hypothetical protein
METSGFQGTSGPRHGSGADINIRLLFATIVILQAEVVKHLKINLRIEFRAEAEESNFQESQGTSRWGHQANANQRDASARGFVIISLYSMALSSRG